VTYGVLRCGTAASQARLQALQAFDYEPKSVLSFQVGTAVFHHHLAEVCHWAALRWVAVD
jgi:hypothetical protein